MANKDTIIGISKVVGVLATVGVLGLGYKYRKEIIGIAKGQKIVSQKAAKIARQELAKWGDGNVKEHDPKTLEDLKRYWASVGLSYNKMKSEPWSAAFLSYVIQQAGAKDTFKYSPSHSVYIREAIQNKKEGKGSWKGYRSEETRVQKGDLVCYARQSGVDYDTTSSYISHCDIVVDVDKKSERATTIGGNVSNSVKTTMVKLTKDGKVENTDKYFVVIKNK